MIREKEEPVEHDVFFCYRRRDRSVVLLLRRKLREKSIAAWMDYKNINLGEPWQQVIDWALENSRIVVIVIGEGGLGSYQTQEVDVALDLRDQGKLKVIPIVLPGALDSDIPVRLRRLQYVDFRLKKDRPFKTLLDGVRRILDNGAN